jgi:hypothetical protein
VVGVVRARWVQVTLSTLLLQLTSWAILFLALRGLQAGAGTVTVAWTEALAAFAFARAALVIPATPGGLGTVDTALTALLTGFGATSNQALGADLVWRAATYLPQVLLGTLTFLWWRVTAARRRQRVTAEHSPTDKGLNNVAVHGSGDDRQRWKTAGLDYAAAGWSPRSSTRSATESTIRDGRNGKRPACSRVVMLDRTRIVWNPASIPATVSVSMRSPIVTAQRALPACNRRSGCR